MASGEVTLRDKMMKARAQDEASLFMVRMSQRLGREFDANEEDVFEAGFMAGISWTLVNLRELLREE